MGNPGGRPRAIGNLRNQARERTAEALQTLVAVTRDTDAPPAARVTAAIAVLDRGWGKPPQYLRGEIAPRAELTEPPASNATIDRYLELRPGAAQNRFAASAHVAQLIANAVAVDPRWFWHGPDA